MKKLFALSALSLSVAGPAFAQDPAPVALPPEPGSTPYAPPAMESAPAPAPLPYTTPSAAAPASSPVAPSVTVAPPVYAAPASLPPTSNQWVAGMAGFFRPDTKRGAGSHGFTASALYGHDLGLGFFGELNLSGNFVDINTADERAFYQEAAMLDIGLAPFGTRGVSFLTPFIIGGAGYEYNDVYQRSIFKGTFVADGGVGVVSGEIIKPLRIRAEIRYLYNNFEGRALSDARASIGFEIPLGEPPAPPRQYFAPPPAQIVTVATPAPVDVDTDGDGVPDSRDQCPGTPLGVKVDSTGCPIPLPPVELPGVNFKTGSAQLQPSAAKALQKALDYLASNPTYKVEVAGHTDSTGSAAKNVTLSQARAESVRAYLVKHGVSSERLSAKGYGSTLPLKSPETTAEDKALNRRVELRAAQ